MEWAVPQDLMFLSNGEVLNLIIERFDSGSTLDSPHDRSIDSIHFVDQFILSKSSDGKIALWNDEKIQFKWSVKDPNNCKVNLSMDGQYFCVGNASGSVYIYHLLTGQYVDEINHKRLSKPITCCAFSHDLKYLILM